MTQTPPARVAGIGRHAVSYWEVREVIPARCWAVERMAEVLPEIAAFLHAERARVRTVIPVSVWQAMEDRAAARKAERVARDAAKPQRLRVPCGARTRNGAPCRCKSEPGKRRCRFHGGMSTGPRTAEGQERIAEAQRQRWARWRAERAA